MRFSAGAAFTSRGKTATFNDDNFVDNVGGSYGGGLNADGAVSVENCTFESNQAEYGGVHVDEVDGDLTLIGSSVCENTATYGGGICADGETSIENTYIAFNIATNGGGLAARTTGTTTVKNSEFHANEATDGGGIYVDTNAGLILEDSEVRGNYADSTEGGGGGVTVEGTATIFDSYLYGNTAAWGGGLHIVGTATAENVEIFGNTATWSAGIDVDYAGNLTLKDSAVSGNSATNSGGGLSVNGAATIT